MTSEHHRLTSFQSDHLQAPQAGKSVNLGKLADCSILWASRFDAKRDWRGRGVKSGVDFIQEFGWYRDDAAPGKWAIADRYGGGGIGCLAAAAEPPRYLAST